MTTKDEALKLAREAITATVGTHGFAFSIEKAKDKAIKAIDEALAEQDSEPVTNDEQATVFIEAKLWEAIDMYMTFPKAKVDDRTWSHLFVYAPQPAPAVQPLTDDEIEDLRKKTFSTSNPYCPVDSKSMRKAVRAAEAAHGVGAPKGDV